jgi:hypothetical protein
MSTVFSADGTAIGFDAWGDGPPLIMIDGATAYRAMSPIAAGRPGDAVELFMTGAVGMPAEMLAGLLPAVSLQAVEGAQHNVEADVLAPALRQFAAAGQAIRH